MTDWAKKRLGDISDSCLGKMLDKAKNKGSYQPYLANLNVQWGMFKLGSLQKMRFEEHEQERYGLEVGDLIICEGGEPGRCAIWRGEVANMKIQKALHRLRVRPEYCSNFLYYRMLLAGRNRELDRHFIGSTIKHLTGVRLKDVEFEFPELDEQKSISTALRLLDKKIELNNKINAELEAMAKLIYDYWFVQFDFPDANGKPYKSSGGKMVYNEALKREIPEGWGEKTLGTLGEFKNGVNYDPSSPGDISCPIINVRNISASSYFLDPNDLDHVFLSEREVRKYSVEDGDIIIARSGIPGATRLMHEFHENTLYCGFAIRFRLKESIWGNMVFFYMKSIEKIISDGSGGTILKNVNQEILRELAISSPNDSVILKQFNEIIEPIFSKLSQVQKENRVLSELRDWLLPMLMNGQVTVKD